MERNKGNAKKDVIWIEMGAAEWKERHVFEHTFISLSSSPFYNAKHTFLLPNLIFIPFHHNFCGIFT